MRCNEVIEKLSAYIDDELSEEEKALVKAHVDGCEACRRELAELKATVLHLRATPLVEPPHGLREKVMADIKAGEKKSLIKRLFHPFHIKIPLEAAALLVTAVFTFYLVKSYSPEFGLTGREFSTTPHKEAPAPPKKEIPVKQEREAPAPAVSDVRIAKTKETPASVAAEKGSGQTLGYSAPAEETVKNEAVSRPETVSEKDKAVVYRRQAFQTKAGEPAQAPAPAPSREKTEMDAISKTVPESFEVRSRPDDESAESFEDAKSAEPPGQKEGELKEEQVMGRLASSKRDIIQLVIHVKDIDLAYKDAKKAIKEIGGKFKDTKASRSSLKTTATLHSDKYDMFISKMSEIGKLEPFEHPKADGMMELRLEFVP